MPVRLTTTATTDTGAEWTPSGDTTLQIVQPENSIVDIQCRADALAPWVSFKSVREHEDRIVKLVQLPELRIACDNPDGGQITVWSD